MRILTDEEIEEYWESFLKFGRKLFSTKTGMCTSKDVMEEYCLSRLSIDREEAVELHFAFCIHCRTLYYLVMAEQKLFSYRHARQTFRKLQREAKEDLIKETLGLISECLKVLEQNYPQKKWRKK